MGISEILANSSPMQNLLLSAPRALPHLRSSFSPILFYEKLRSVRCGPIKLEANLIHLPNNVIGNDPLIYNWSKSKWDISFEKGPTYTIFLLKVVAIVGPSHPTLYLDITQKGNHWLEMVLCCHGHLETSIQIKQVHQQSFQTWKVLKPTWWEKDSLTPLSLSSDHSHVLEF